ncbi:uncharacterized protein LOC132927533 [Rhopalosiphum padi]|uniref:uncharacterized protein LOC132927533 n=1 Tax=Rhopalosiphum padi TaxID=40932 RepID=UPI00298EB709|nr:uncharacterized protein LOC132927533 [Rhopalosiphum padi]
MELSKETGEPMEVDEITDSPSIVHNNHINKKKQSKSRISTPGPNAIKNNRSNKRHKNDNTRSDTLKSLELHIPPSSKLTTPKFNFNSTNNRILRSGGRKDNYNIKDAIFKVPFEHGWKRELVYRTSGESAVVTRANKSGDVYYYSPNGQKLRSLREIQEQLDISSDKTSLTIDCFTFLTQPIGMNDQSKEVIIDADFKRLRDDTTVGVAVQPKKSKTPKQRPPFDCELTGDGNKKSASKVKKVFKNAKTSSGSRSKKELTTPKLNVPYIAPPKNRMVQSAVIDIDSLITDSIFKIPFEHGWKRELVYKTSGEFTVDTRANGSGDVFYYSPNGLKLRSLQEIQEQLDISSDKTSLTIDCFTFLAQPIFVYDKSKEQIKVVNLNLYKHDTSVGGAVQPKKSKTPKQRPPFDCELTGDGNKKSASKVKKVFKNAKTSSGSRSKKDLTTPKLNVSYIDPPINRMVQYAVIDIDSLITDSIFKIPFKHGWKRDLVYKTSGESAVDNQANRSGDVYYYSPNGQKLRSLQEIQEHLDISSDKTSLTIDCFTFLAQPIFLNDEHRERIRDASFKLFKDETIDDDAVLLQISKTLDQRPPLNNELTDDGNKKSAS